MGAEQWAYSVSYQPDIAKALHELREREFRAGRYYPVEWFPPFLPAADAPAPGAEHDSIEEAIEAADDEGTRSILDIETVGTDPDAFEAGTVVPLSEETLADSFGTAQPTREILEEHLEEFVSLDRGEGAYIVTYREGKPAEIFFIGCTYD